MRKSLVVFLLPVLLASSQVDSTEIDFTISNKENYQLNAKATDNRFTEVPSNPNLYQAADTYLDKDLTQKRDRIEPNTPFTIEGVEVNTANQVVFFVSGKGYLVADTANIYDDVILSKETIQADYWLKKGFTIYSSPIGNQQKKVTNNLKSYKAVAVIEKVTTQLGEFAKIDESTYIPMSDLSQEDNRIEAVQELLTSKYTSSKYGIYVKQLSTQKEAGVNQDSKMYAASTSKLATLYYAQKQLDSGKLKLTTPLQYIDKVTNFKGSYSAEGSGSLVKKADNKPYSVEDMINRVAKQSDNAASNLLAYYITNQFDDVFYREITSVTGDRWDMSDRKASAKMAGLMMEAIYHQGGFVLGSLQSTNFDAERISRDISVPVAHKIGDAYDFRHDVALVYAEDPFVLSIFTDGSDYETISKIANDVYGILK